MNEIVRDFGGPSAREEVTLGATAKTGDIVFTTSGLAGVIVEPGDHASGDRVAVCTDCLVELDSASATTFSAEVAVSWHTTNKLAVANATAGSRAVGFAARAKTNGQVTVLVRLNQRIPQVTT